MVITLLPVEAEIIPRRLVLDPALIYVYEPGSEASAASGMALYGKGPVERFILDLDQLWRCYEL
jgi:hypothetical protein